MSTLTKILVVILVVLAIAHSAVLLAYLSQQRSWKTLARERSEDVDTLRAQLKSNNQANTLTQQRLSKERDAFKAQLDTNESRWTQAQTDLADLRLQLGKLTIDNDTFRQQLSNLNDSLTRAQQARDHAGAQLDRARNTASDLKTENSQLEREVAKLLKDVTVLNAEVSRKKEQIAALQEDIRKASGRTTVRAPVVLPVQPSALVARRPINGKIVAVNLDAKIATVNVGSIAGVSEGTRFTIFNDDPQPYVGDLMITSVLRDQSIGTIVMSAKPVRLGNQVSTDPLR